MFGGESAENFFYSASDLFRGELRNSLRILGAAAEKGDGAAWQEIKKMIKYLLMRGRILYQYTAFEFGVSRIRSKDPG